MRLVTPDEMPKVEGLQTPERFYRVLKLPTPLAGMAYPDATTPWDRLHEHGFRRIVRLHEGTPYDPSPTRLRSRTSTAGPSRRTKRGRSGWFARR